MKTVIRPETEMKDSGIEWIGVIPKEWSIIKGKYIYFVQAGYPFNSEYFSLIKGMPLIRIRDITSGKCETYFDGDYLDEYVVNNTDLLIGMDGDFNVRWWESGQAVLNQRCCRIIEKNNISRKYLYYALPFGLKELNDLTYFTTVKHLSNNGILNLNFPFPPLSEQQAIANYLDATCSKIDEIIAEAKASIDEYKELKQSVIFEAVTKGLDKNVEMKESGYDFIGCIPKHWNITKLKRICSKISDGSHFSPETVNEGLSYVTASDVHGVGISYNHCRKISKDDYDKLVKLGCRPSYMDILMVKDGATTGRVGLKNDDSDCVLLSSVAMLTPKASVDPYYLMWLLSSDILQFQIKKSMAGSAMPRITLTKLNNFVVIDCPLEEQVEIVNRIDEVAPIYDSLIAEKESLINDLEAYKKSLIYEVVTGKRKVV